MSKLSNVVEIYRLIYIKIPQFGGVQEQKKMQQLAIKLSQAPSTAGSQFGGVGMLEYCGWHDLEVKVRTCSIRIKSC